MINWGSPMKIRGLWWDAARVPIVFNDRDFFPDAKFRNWQFWSHLIFIDNKVFSFLEILEKIDQFVVVWSFPYFLSLLPVWRYYTNIILLHSFYKQILSVNCNLPHLLNIIKYNFKLMFNFFYKESLSVNCNLPHLLNIFKYNFKLIFHKF